MSVDTVKDLIFGIIGGSALLMYGVDLMGEGLEKAAGKAIKKALSIMTNSLLCSFLTGTAVTALVQSSTAVTVLTVGFVNANLLGLKQAVGIIYGANIGTTITAQMMAFDLTGISLPAIGLGYILMYISKKDAVRYLGQGVLGFGMLFLGLRLINLGVPFLQQDAGIVYFCQAYSDNMLVSLIIGILVTISVQSSSAVMGITMILGQAGLITIDGAIGLMLGSNIGTCATAQIAAVSGSISAKRAAWSHTLYNIIGALIALIVIKPFIWIVKFISPGMPIERQIANSHTLFNILSAVIFLPFTDLYVKIIERIVPDRKFNN